ncbi:hypothetical protein PV327_009803 [Microctonus hyperodae]|uniref:Uncharacterized protein n=1 Tax=Microctonus hyperodae TaxID=165561 RepID=A0AA39CBV2_MICHY|nr:hypothetical protein PV327_009803 [Microctonus hyperodae]
MDEYCTSVKMHNFEYKWKIQNFSSHIECAENQNDEIAFKSTSFTVNNNTKWHLKLLIHGYKNNAKDFIGLFTYFDNKNEQPQEVFASQIFFLVSFDGKKIKVTRSRMHKFIAITLNSWGYDKFFRKKTLLDYPSAYLPNDELTIICELNIMDYKSISIDNYPKLMNNQFSDDFTKFYMNKKFSDVTLILQDEKIPGHKIILSAKSPVFAKILDYDDDNNNEEQNNLNNEIIINDSKPEIFKTMLYYVYTNEIKDIDKVELDLIWTANKYKVKGLSEICEKKLCKKIIIDNVIDYLVKSNTFHAETLMKYCQDFIHAHIEELMKTSKYKDTEKKYPELIANIYRSSVVGNQRKKMRIYEIPEENNFKFTSFVQEKRKE